MLFEAAGDACPRCASPVGPWADSEAGCSKCHGRPLGFDAAIALGPYQGPIRDLCIRLKRDHHGWIAPWLGRLTAEARPALSRLADEGGSVVVPIPLHWRRAWSRGYNQSEELARGLAAALGLPRANALRRVKPTERSDELDRAARVRSLRGAFSLRRGREDRIRGRTVLLVDDVLTTGATCAAAARALKKAGAARVVAVVVGRA
jgi:ComF family protein